MDEFIDVKGMKSQGNQITKLKVKEIVLDHEIEGDEPWPEREKPTVTEATDDESATTVEWEIKSESEEETDQGKLF